MDDAHRMCREEQRQLPFESREIAGLDFDQLLAAHNVDHKAIDRFLDGIARLRVPGLQLRVQQPFAQRADTRAASLAQS